MELDWGKESKREFTLYPAGTYKVRLKSFEHTTAKTGTPQILWKNEIVAPEDLKGKQLSDYTAMTEKALWRLAWLVSAYGINVEKLGKMNTDSSAFHKILNACIGRTAYWHVVVELNQSGQERNGIDDFKKDDEQEPLDFETINAEDLPDWLEKGQDKE